MSISHVNECEFGAELPAFEPDTRLATGAQFAELIGWGGTRFTDHEGAKKEGLPGAMSQGFLVAMIHRWAPDAEIKTIDTVFWAPVIADEPHHISGVVTDIDTDAGMVEIDLTVMNSKDETRVFGTATVKLPN